jgi:hypothetical protein
MKRSESVSEFAEFWRLLERFEEEPSLENYVGFRRSFGPDAQIHRFADVDPLRVETLKTELERARISPSLVIGALGGYERDIDELCLQLMERLIERRRLEAKGETQLQSRGKAISDALVGHLTVTILEVLQQDDLSPMPFFVVLVREQLGGPNNEVFKNHTKWEGRSKALFLGMRMMRRGLLPTIRKIADAMKVQPSTVSRWFPDGDFLKQVEEFGRSFRELGIDDS